MCVHTELACFAHVRIAHEEPGAGAFVGGRVEGHGAPVLVHDGTGTDRPVDGVGYRTAHRRGVALDAVKAGPTVHLGRQENRGRGF